MHDFTVRWDHWSGTRTWTKICQRKPDLSEDQGPSYLLASTSCSSPSSWSRDIISSNGGSESEVPPWFAHCSNAWSWWSFCILIMSLQHWDEGGKISNKYGENRLTHGDGKKWYRPAYPLKGGKNKWHETKIVYLAYPNIICDLVGPVMRA